MKIILRRVLTFTVLRLSQGITHLSQVLYLDYGFHSIMDKITKWKETEFYVHSDCTFSFRVKNPSVSTLAESGLQCVILPLSEHTKKFVQDLNIFEQPVNVFF